MSRRQLIQLVAKRTGLKQADVAAVMEAFLSVLQEELLQGEKVTLRGFGTFSLELKRPRTARNLRTGEPMRLPARLGIRFTPACSLNEALQKNTQLLRRFEKRS